MLPRQRVYPGKKLAMLAMLKIKSVGALDMGRWHRHRQKPLFVGATDTDKPTSTFPFKINGLQRYILKFYYFVGVLNY